MIAGLTYYQICSYFLIYSFLGWVIEVMYHAVTLGKVVNRGFLNGPVCPVYGFGMLAILALLNSIDTGDPAVHIKPVYIFIFGMILTTAIELTAGWALDKIFHARWWDYSDKPLNFHGYICLEFSIIWGLGVVFIVEIVHPFIAGFQRASEPSEAGWILMAAAYILLTADLIVTVAIVRGLNKRFEELDQLRLAMRKGSDLISEYIADNTIEAAQDIQDARIQSALARAELKEDVDEKVQAAENHELELKRRRKERAEEYRKRLEEEISSLGAHQIFGSGRVFRAFPDLQSRRHPELLDEIRQRLDERKNQ